MSVFDLVEVRGFVADLDARMTSCQNGDDGIECATIDDALRHHAALCREFNDKVRQWGREVFAGTVGFNPAVERELLREGRRLYARAKYMKEFGRRAEDACFILEGRGDLLSAFWDLEQLLKGWVSPKLAVSPSARQKLVLDPSAAEAARKKLAALPPLPDDWQPEDPQQQAMYRLLQTS